MSRQLWWGNRIPAYYITLKGEQPAQAGTQYEVMDRSSPCHFYAQQQQFDDMHPPQQWLLTVAGRASSVCVEEEQRGGVRVLMLTGGSTPLESTLQVAGKQSQGSRACRLPISA